MPPATDSLGDLQRALGVSARDISCLLLRADPHRWGAGRIHLIDEENDKTYCGQSPARCPGTKVRGAQDQVTCKTCIQSIEARLRAEEMRRQFAAEAREDEERQRLWWRHYDEYLQTKAWFEKRALVIRRSGGVCEGCGKQRAAQVHHRAYPRDCQPGSSDWIAREKLFDLVALCFACHEDMHG